jgi:hypothetical protein
VNPSAHGCILLIEDDSPQISKKPEKIAMKPNIGTIDKAVRIFAGVFVLSLMMWGPRTMWGLVGLVPLVTAAMGFCPLYTLLRVSTRKKEAVIPEQLRK